MKALKRSANNPTMLRTLIIALVLILCWEPIRPVRTVTADLLVHVSDMIRQ